MKFGDTIVDGVFLERPNRYLARVEIDGEETLAHVPDPGRLPGLMIPQRKVRLIHKPSETRKTQYTLALVRHGRIWVSVYPVFANTLVKDGLSRKKIDCFGGFDSFSSEVKHGGSRFDFCLAQGGKETYVEVKSVSLVEETVGKFPDAPTERGRKHVEELIQLKQKGFGAAVLFVSQRSDTRSITSNDAIDPKFGKALRRAQKAGVKLFGMNCKVTASSISLDQNIPVET